MPQAVHQLTLIIVSAFLIAGVQLISMAQVSVIYQSKDVVDTSGKLVLSELSITATFQVF
jgi:hypothetical protein